jgi:high affinity sulfate transporter 1
MGGLGLAAFAIPESMAYAALAGLPPQAGIYGYLVGGPAFALFTTARHVAVGPTSAISMIVAATLGDMASGDPTRYAQLAATTALMVAAMALLAWLLRLDQLVQFIAEPILYGFKAGVALTIASKQIPHLLGMESHGAGVFSRFAYTFVHLGDVHVPSMLLGLGAIALIILGEKKLPGGVVVLGVVVLSIAASAQMDLKGNYQVKVAHEVPGGLPRPSLPYFSLHEADDLVALAFACFLLGFIETSAVGRTFGMKHRYSVNPRREMLALAAANVATGFFRSYPVSGGMSQSAVNEQSGARSPWSLVFAATAIALVLLFLTGPFRYLPEPTLAALVLAAVAGMIQRKHFRHLREVSPIEFRAAIIALMGVLLLGILRGVLLAVVATLIMVIARVSKPSASVRGRLPGSDHFTDLGRRPEAQAVPDVLVYRLDVPLIYFNVNHVRDDVMARVRAAKPHPRLVVFDLAMSPNLDLAAVCMLVELEDQLKNLKAELRLADVHARARERLRAEDASERFGGVTERRVGVAAVVDAWTAQAAPGSQPA